jgi:hypothetical protein
MLDQVLQIVKSDRIAIRLYLLATNPNTDKPIDIQSRPNIKEYSISAKNWDQTICKFS